MPRTKTLLRQLGMGTDTTALADVSPTSILPKTSAWCKVFSRQSSVFRKTGDSGVTDIIVSTSVESPLLKEDE